MYSSLSTGLVAVCVVLPISSTLFVGLRYKVRRSTNAGLGADDYTIIAAELSTYAGAALLIYAAVAGGEGDTQEDIAKHPAEAARYTKIIFAGPIIFALAISLIKTSTLLLYKRIFVTSNFYLVCHIMMGLTLAWFLASIFGQIFRSDPVSKGWTEPGRYDRINYTAFLCALAAINTVLDFALVCLPLPVIRTLSMSPKRKLSVSGIFLLGFVCIIASIVRLYYFVLLNNGKNTPNTAYTNVATENSIWSVVEPHMSVVAACLPTFGPLYQHARSPASMMKSFRSLFSLSSISSTTKGKGDTTLNGSTELESKDSRSAWLRLQSDGAHKNNVSYDPDVEWDGMREGQPAPRGILVQKSVESRVGRDGTEDWHG